MIQSLQKFSQSRVAKVFLALVALSFVAFFGGSNWFQSQDRHAVIAEIGNVAVGRYELFEKTQRHVQQMMAESGQSMTKEEILQSGLPQMVLNRLIQDNLLNLEAQNLGLTVSDEQVKNQIHSMKVFQDDKGFFNKTLFANVIHSVGLSEDAFVKEIRQELIRAQLMDAIQVGVVLPESMVKPLFEAQYQHRQASLVVVSPKEIAPPALPSDATLEEFYNQHKNAFKTPELRALTVFVINPTALGKAGTISEEDIKALYENKPEVYGKKSLAEAKPLIVAELQKERGSEKAFELSQSLDDKVAGGATLEELATQEQDVALIKLVDVNAQGYDRLNEISPNLPEDKEFAQEILATGFSLEEGTDSPFTQAKSGHYFLIRTDKITPATLQPFAQIRDVVLKAWTEFEQMKVAHEKAKTYVESFNKGDRKVSMMKLLPSVSLSTPSPDVPDAIKELVFSLRLNQAGMVKTPEGFAVVVLNNIIPPTTKVWEEKMEAFKLKLLQSYKDDFTTAYTIALRVRYHVKINENAFQALFTDNN